MRRTTTIVCAAAVLSALAPGGDSRGAGSAERRLQPFAQVESGGHVDARDLETAPVPHGARRAARWEAARAEGLDGLIVRPLARRGSYNDRGALHAAWSARR